MTHQTLDQMAIGSRSKIIGFAQTEANFRRKLLALGLMPGAVVEVRRLAPLGDPMQIQLRGASISLRKLEAATIYVESVV
jgi:ferrous iron transport protein A